MKKVCKILIIFFAIVLVYVLALSLFHLVRNIYLVSYNIQYIDNYFKENLDNCIVENVERYSYHYDIFGNSSSEFICESTTKEDVLKDNIDKSYTEVYYLYDTDLDYHYTIEFHHDSYDKISMVSTKDRQYYKERKSIYLDNYDKIENLIIQNNGKSILLSAYNDSELEYYILLIYVPNIDNAIDIQNTLYDNIYGGYALDHVEETNGINIDFPRYIFINNIELFYELSAHCNEVQEFTKYKSYECIDSRINTTNKNTSIVLSDIVELLFGKEMSYTRYNSRNTTLNTEFFDLPKEKWLITFQLEIGVDYYTDVYDL